ncbi:MAG: hypothetical protein Q8P30_00240 [Candidatus Uhrbacteria bacterium]|nr:hypothetical protein [Candidatus Uhrbacteria bacterium]
MEKRMLVCIQASHCFEVEPGSEADKEFKNRKYLKPGQCPECNEDCRVELTRNLHTCAIFCECDMGLEDTCKDGCCYERDLADVPDDPYGLVFLPTKPEMASYAYR